MYLETLSVKHVRQRNPANVIQTTDFTPFIEFTLDAILQVLKNQPL